jgi:RNA polymerase sigma factor (sigma-70 family)
MTYRSLQDDLAPPDGLLARAAADGDRSALDALLRRHQRWIYSLALRMVWDGREAEDATQEILLKIATRLGSFRGESAFRTWAWRIAANHLLSWRRGRTEEVIQGFECYGAALAATADMEPTGAEPEERLLVQEAAIGCTVGMLLCLDREQRLAFVLGEIFGVTDAEGAEVMGIGRDAFRQRLSRARRQLYEFLQDRCGLADPRNPCRCERKTRGFVKAGIVDPRRLVFAEEHVARVEQVAPARADALGRAASAGFARLYRSQPLQEGPDLAARLLTLLDDPGLLGPPPRPLGE